MDSRDANLTIGPNRRLKEAMQKIDRNGWGIVFVVDDQDRLLGTATDGDIRGGLLSGRQLDTSVSEVMNESPVALRESWSPDDFSSRLNMDEVREKAPNQGSLAVPVLDESGRFIRMESITPQAKLVEDIDPPGVERVLIIGGAGYLGSVLSEALLDKGYEVRVLDNLIYGSQGVADFTDRDSFELIEGDVRSIETVTDCINGVDAVVHLGALVGDPASSIDPQKTLEMNYHATKMVAEICKYHQINRFIFASTCSVYGVSDDPEDILTEASGLNPVSLYAQSKLESERALLDMTDETFSPTILRMATIYGLSPRMRFDLVVNILSAKAHVEGTIPIFGGEQYRPNVHVRDAAQAYIECMEAPIDSVAGEIYNVGSEEQNYRIKELGEIVSACFPEATIDHQPDKEDERSYQVDFSKIESELGFAVEQTVADACEEIKTAFEEGRFDDYTDSKYNNFRTLENHILLFRETPESIDD
jgi:nucleoside-diphosphate-sugar epimerase